MPSRARRHRHRAHARRQLLSTVAGGLALLVITAATVVLGLPQLARSSGSGNLAGEALPAAAGPTSGAPEVARQPAKPGPASPQPALRLNGPVPERGSGEFRYAAGEGPLLGRSGTVQRFRVAVEDGSAEDPDEFAAIVEATLGDPRSWTGDGRTRLRRVPAAAPADFTVYLATGATASRMCLAGGVDIRVAGEPYTSCRAPGKVVVNLSRWRLSVPEYVDRRVSLEQYRQYVVNHEVGHELGHGHEDCPGAGRPAPVMVQQTLTLRGCRPYSWPRLDGDRYAGPAV